MPTITLAAGTHVIRTSEGVRTGLQLDRLVLASGGRRKPARSASDGRVTGLGATAPPAPKVTVVHNGETHMRVHVSGATTPFWLVLGESQSAGWKAATRTPAASARSRLVDGYTNGWLVRPTHSSFDVVLEWTPQRTVWAAVWISALAALLCFAIIGWALVRRPARPRRSRLPTASDADVSIEWPVPPRLDPTRSRARTGAGI